MQLHVDSIAWIVFAAFVALIVTTFVFPKVLWFAKKHNIMDNPNARKLQRTPIPVLGGIAVYIGILMGFLVLAYYYMAPVILLSLVAITVMQVLGIWDDVSELSTWFRFCVESILVGALLWALGMHIDSFHGLWGIQQIDGTVAVVLSVVAGVGIINAVNMIDGVDGYVSGFCMQACLCFSILFLMVGEYVMAGMALVVMASLLPFFLHNVFGVRSKMFIGDGGTMMLGILVVIFVFLTLSSKSKCSVLENSNVGLVAFALAVMCIPVFDTLRVMTLRILRGYSPFQSDKTHLHHLFIEMGFSHLGAALSIVLINQTIILVWLLLWRMGASVESQTYAVVLMGLAVTFGFYKLMKCQQFGGRLDKNGNPQGTPLWHFFCKLGDMSHIEKGRIWRSIRWLMDNRWW